MLLVADIGNSSIVLGLWTEDGRIAHRWRIRSDPRRTPDETGVLLRALLDTAPAGIGRPDHGCFASVVPPMTHVMIEAAHDFLGIAVDEFRYAPELGIRLEVDEPGQVGADRIANAVAAHIGIRGPAIVVDFGTATNFDIIAADGLFLGGIIAPGLESGFEVFASKTALLPRIAPAFPESVIGRTTVDNMQIGVYRGMVAMVDGLVAEIRAEWEAGATVVATGGLSGLVAGHCRTVDRVDPDHTLKGIGWGFDRLHPLTV